MKNFKKILTAVVIGITAMTATAQTWEIGAPNAESVIATLDANGTMRIHGTGEMRNWDLNAVPWRNVRQDIRSVIIEDGVTGIGRNAFNGASLSELTIGRHITRIGDQAFSWASSLTKITVLATVRPNLGFSVFSNVNQEIPVFVPHESVVAYRNWGGFTNIVALCIWGEIITTSATCEADGSEFKTCNICGETETRTIPQLTGEDCEVVIPPDCANCNDEGCAKCDTDNVCVNCGGYKICTCPECANCNDEGCNICKPITYTCKLCSDVGCEICEPCAHGNHDESGAAATCTTPKICNRDGCNHIYINALGHILNDLDNWTIAKHATCIEAGSRERIRNCTRANCNHNEKQTAVLSVDPTAHDWSEEITIPATCDETGSIKKICNRAACDESVILQILTKLENCDGTSIVNIQKSDNSHGIRFAVNPVSDNAEISVILSNNEIARETKIAIYDMTGNVVVSSTSTGSVTTATGGAFVWDLRNSAGRFVANGTYLVIAEVKSTSGKIYRYSARLGVKR